MNSVLRSRTLTEILASRTRNTHKNRKAKAQHVTLVDVPHEWKLETLIRKGTYNNEDKIALIRFIQKKYRIRFGLAFVAKCFSWVIETGKSIINKHYDSKKKSIFLLKGKVSLCRKEQSLRQTNLRSTNLSCGLEQIQVLNEGGLGCVFSAQEDYQNIILVAENAIILSIDHPQGQLLSLERNCLMTTQQKQNTLKTFPMFNSLTSLNKYYTPYFQTKLYCKGEAIYSLGEEAQYLYLVVQGQIELESKIPVQNPETERKGQQSIAQLTLRNTYSRYLSVNTESLSSGSFFGEEQLIDLSMRHQNAKCASITALLILIPLDKFTKLMYYNEIRDIFTSTAQQRQVSRDQTISAALSLQSHKNQITNNNLSERSVTELDFKDLNKHIYQDKDMQKQQRRLSLPGEKFNLVHGNPIKVNRYKRTTPESFSMLEVNRIQYQVSAKRFKLWNSEKKKKQMSKTQGSFQSNQKETGDRARSLKQVWQVLKLDQVLQQSGERIPLENSDGKFYYKAHMKLMHHLGQVKRLRPNTTSASTRAKSQYLEYLQRAGGIL